MIIAVDFDGTLCVKSKFPEIGEPNNALIEGLKKRQSLGDKLILWTCRSNLWLDNAVMWCLEQGLEFDAINEDLPEIKGSYFGKNKSNKVFAHIYIDDANWFLSDAESGNYPEMISRHKVATKEQAHGSI